MKVLYNTSSFTKIVKLLNLFHYYNLLLATENESLKKEFKKKIENKGNKYNNNNHNTINGV